MDLFSSSGPENLLPFDGEAIYYGTVINRSEAHHYFEALMETVEWKHDEAVMMGKHLQTKRKVAWYGDKKYLYTYSNTTKEALLWTKELLELKNIAEKVTGITYNSCLLNLYHNGNEGMAWHSDDEKALVKHKGIASISLGAERNFCFKHKASKQRVCKILESGSLLLMKGTTQKYWWHRLPPTKKVNRPRINLTFRTIASEI